MSKNNPTQGKMVTSFDSAGLNPEAVRAIQQTLEKQQNLHAQYKPGFDLIEQEKEGNPSKYADIQQPVAVSLSVCPNMHISTVSYKIAKTADWASSEKRRIYSIFPSSLNKEEKRSAKGRLFGLMSQTHEQRMDDLLEAWVFNKEEAQETHRMFRVLWSGIQDRVSTDNSGEKELYKKADAFVVQLDNQWRFVSKKELVEYKKLFDTLETVIKNRQKAGPNARHGFLVAATVLGVGLPFGGFIIGCYISMILNASRDLFDKVLTNPACYGTVAALVGIALILVIVGNVMACQKKVKAPQRYPFPDNVRAWCKEQSDKDVLVGTRISGPTILTEAPALILV